MPSFESSGARSGYTLAHLVPRTSKLADLVQLEEPAWLRSAVERATAHALSGGEVVSIAGGPGFDLTALALLRGFGRLPLPTGGELHVRVLDYEAGWAEQAGAMEAALRRCLPHALRCSFGGCDSAPARLRTTRRSACVQCLRAMPACDACVRCLRAMPACDSALPSAHPRRSLVKSRGHSRTRPTPRSSVRCRTRAC